MADREKVINGLREMSCRATWKDIDRIRHKFQPIINDAIAMLKEQEAIQVPEDKINKCECGETVCRYWHPKFCGFCGRELLWY